MALPDELLDELLSAHLDGVTSGDERARVEQLLRDDPQIAQRLEQLESQRDALRRSVLTAPKLPDSFADQVVRAAIEQARAEGLREDHPLRLAGDKLDSPRVSPRDATTSTLSKPRVIALIAGLAASLLFIAAIVQQFGDDTQPQLVAELPVDATTPEPAEPRPAEPRPAEPQLAEPGRETIAQADPALAQPLSGETPSSRAEVAVPEMHDAESIASSEVDSESARPMLADAGESTAPQEAAIPEAAVDGAASVPPAELVARVPLPRLQMLLVIEVKRSEAGQAIGAFEQALGKVGIESGSEREVDEDLVRAVAKDSKVESVDQEDRQVILLESPAKKLDNLVNQLIADREGIEGIAFSAITLQQDASLMRSIESVRTDDPTKIRHQGQGIPIVSRAEDVFDEWVGEVGARQFASMREGQSDQIVKAMISADDNGPDQMANILFLVR